MEKRPSWPYFGVLGRWAEQTSAWAESVLHASAEMIVKEVPSVRALLRHGLVGYPEMARAGLGHMMNAWALCDLWCRDRDVPMLAPQWRKLRLGPYVRREPDKRQYHRFFVNDGYLDGLERAGYLLAGRVVPPESPAIVTARAGDMPLVVMFRETHHFSAMKGRHAEVLREIVRITRPSYLRAARAPGPFVGLHVRRGDFGVPKEEATLRTGRHNVRTPVEWYLSALRAIRRAVRRALPAVVFSDGRPRELEVLLAEPGVRLAPVSAAISDMLLMAQAKALVGAGSGFSQWAAFLGQMPSVWHPGQRLERVLDASSREVDLLEFELEKGETLPDVWVARVAASLSEPGPVGALLGPEKTN